MPVCGRAVILGEDPPPCVCGGGWYRGDLCACSDQGDLPSVYLAEAGFPAGIDYFVAPFNGCYEFDRANFVEELPPGAIVIPTPTVIFPTCEACCTFPPEPCCSSPLNDGGCFWPENFAPTLSVEWGFRYILKHCCPDFAGGTSYIVTNTIPFFGEMSWPVDVTGQPALRCTGAERDFTKTQNYLHLTCGGLTTDLEAGFHMRVTAHGFGSSSQPRGFGVAITAAAGELYAANDYSSCHSAEFNFNECVTPSNPFLDPCGSYCTFRLVGFVRITATRVPCSHGSAAPFTGNPADAAAAAIFEQQIKQYGCQGCGQ